MSNTNDDQSTSSEAPAELDSKSEHGEGPELDGSPKYDENGKRIWPRGPGTRRKRTQADIVRARERSLRRQKVLDLRVAGRNPTEIAREVGVSVRQVNRDLTKALNSVPLETAEHARKVSVARRERELATVSGAAIILAKRIKAMVDAGQQPDVDDLLALAKMSLARGRHLDAIENLTVPPLPQRVEHTGARGGPINIAALPDDQLRDLVLTGLLPQGDGGPARAGDASVEGEAESLGPAADGGDAVSGVLGAIPPQAAH